jgi:hypothetical protein
VKDAMESMTREMCQAIKEELFLRLGIESEYESGRESAIREAIVKARRVIKKENESR